MKRTSENLVLGSNTVEILLPHRRPLLMVDGIRDFCREPEPALTAVRHVSANEAVFDGHFPALNLWPGIYTIEGMGQTCQLLATMLELARRFEERGEDLGFLLRALRNVDRGFTLHPGYKAEEAREFRALMARPEAGFSLGLASSIDVKLVAPVFAGSLLVYGSRLTHRLDDHLRFEVSAAVGARAVARGLITAVIERTAPAP